MIFTAPAFLPTLPSPLPLLSTIGDFCLKGNLAEKDRPDLTKKQHAFVDAATDQAWAARDIDARVAEASAALSSAWNLNPGQQWHKVVAILASNSVDLLILSWAIHRLGGGCLMLQPTSSATEIAGHLDHLSPVAMFVSQDLLSLGQDAVQRSCLPPEVPLYTLAVPGHPGRTSTVDGGRDLAPVYEIAITAEEANRRVAYYCTTSGTSGIQHIVAITHKNIIAGVLQAASFYKATREKACEVALGFLPFNHIYGLLVTHTLVYYGDCVIIHRGFNMMEVLTSIARYRINTLYLVPPIINALSRNASILDKFDLSSVGAVVSGGGPFDEEAFARLQAVRPNWHILGGWGQTEISAIGSWSHAGDIFPGSSGVLLPGVRIRLRNDDGHEVEALDEMGEIEIASPSVTRGYVDQTSLALLPCTDDDGNSWWSTGDMGLFRVSPSGEKHLFIVDRIRDMIKVKGIQVAPGQIEAHLSKHPSVAECAVVGIPDEIAGERALAFIVPEPSYVPSSSHTTLVETIRDHNDLVLPEVCRLQDRIIFVDQIPKNASGKVLKRELRKDIRAGATTARAKFAK